MDECKPLIKTRVETAYGVCNQRLKLERHKLISTLAFNFNLRRCNQEEDPDGGNAGIFSPPPGRAVQVEPMKPMFKAPGTKR